MQLERYQKVIERVFSEHTDNGYDPIGFYEDLVKSLQIAETLMGDLGITTTPAPLKKRNVSMETKIDPKQWSDSKTANPRAVLLSVAPPVADAGNSSDEPEDDIDYYESKPGKGDGANRLQVIIQNMLPASIEVQIPGIEKPLTLVRGVGSPGIRFVYVNYSIPGDTMGCRYTIMTSQKNIDPDVILQDILSQAASFYSAEKRVVVPHAPKLDLMPTSKDLAEVMDRDRKRINPHNAMAELDQEEAKLAAEDAKDFQANRVNNPRWQ